VVQAPLQALERDEQVFEERMATLRTVIEEEVANGID
jgi:hypothetical protein